LILLDLKLPRVSGLELLQWIRTHLGSRIVVIVLTSSALDSDIEKAHALGATAFLIKPTDISVLQSMLKSTCDFWLTHNTFAPATTSQSPNEGVVSLDTLGKQCELPLFSCILPSKEESIELTALSA
ncbi:MAG: response regulator, partial [Limisphaerales bacterium]